MRKIQFRGKRHDGQWRYGSYCFIAPNNHRIITEINNWEYSGVDPDTIGQFTGLLDKNEKEIYEGDIMRQEIKDAMEDGGLCIIIFEIKFENGCFGWIGETTGLFHSFQSYEDMLSYEVVGNIFDNPEMLKS